MCPGPKLLSCWCQKSCSAQHLKGLWHSSTLDYLWGHRAHYQWRQRRFTGNGSPVFAELEECDKVSGATKPRRPPLIIKADRASLMSCLHPNIHTSCFCQKGALAHKRIDTRGSCLLSVWLRGKSWDIRQEAVTQLRARGGKERYEGRWKEELHGDDGHCLRAAPISQLESDQSPGTNTHTHIYSNCASLAALIRADMPFILLLLEHTPHRQQVNLITGYHNWTHSGPGISLLARKCLHPYYLNIFTCDF